MHLTNNLREVPGCCGHQGQDNCDQPVLDGTSAFTLVWAFDQSFSAEVPGAGDLPPFSPTLAVVITGGSPCKIGDFAKLHLHVANPGKPGVVVT